MFKDINQFIRKDEEPVVALHLPNEYEIKNGIQEGLKNIDSMNERDAFTFVNRYIRNLFQTTEYYSALFKPKFLMALNQACHDTMLDADEIINLNSMIYKAQASKGSDNYLNHLMFMVGETINKATVNKMLGQGLDNEMAIYIGIANQSSFNPIINIKRVNFILTAYPKSTAQFFTIQKLVNIYQSLYVNCFSKLLSAVTFDTVIKFAIENNDPWVNQDMIDIDENIGLAVLFILESVPPQNVTQYLMLIAEQYATEFGYDAARAKISFHNLPRGQFVKIPIIVEQLEGLEDSTIVIP